MMIERSRIDYNSNHGRVHIKIMADPFSLNTSYMVFVNGEEKIRAITSMYLDKKSVKKSVQNIYPKK